MFEVINPGGNLYLSRIKSVKAHVQATHPVELVSLNIQM